ncbi:hypothetical protein [Amycolatopsis aidingensis]|uniref:hypothetical protein n=1 Tax=Amycolatopsis aidingensis TaxID=2842453 RepID=UPI001C0B1A0F|nr:hypothetical protein [Amycolatopsis aidingensis]
MQTKRGRPVAGILVLVLAGMSIAVPQAAAGTTTETYGQYSRMFERSAGQFWADGQAAGQWAWDPRSAGESRISWGDPKNWPPSYHEKFVRSGDWVLLDGWYSNGTYYSLNVTSERVGDADCHNLRELPDADGRQHYTQWTIQDRAYCLKAHGTITEQSTGKQIDFGHTQIWYPPAECSNPYYGRQRCVKQWESWWDNNGSPGEPIKRRLEREQLIASGIGMAFTIQQWHPKHWRADLRSHWTW